MILRELGSCAIPERCRSATSASHGAQHGGSPGRRAQGALGMKEEGGEVTEAEGHPASAPSILCFRHLRFGRTRRFSRRRGGYQRLLEPCPPEPEVTEPQGGECACGVRLARCTAADAFRQAKCNLCVAGRNGRCEPRCMATLCTRHTGRRGARTRKLMGRRTSKRASMFPAVRSEGGAAPGCESLALLLGAVYLPARRG